MAIREYFIRYGETFLVRFSDESEVLRVLDGDGPEARLFYPNPDRRPRVREVPRKVVWKGR